HAVDECNGGCDKTTGQCTPKVSTPCTDTDNNICTIAGCELSPGDPTTGVCVQNHMFEHDSVPCPDTDGNACTTAGCNGAGVCDQSHMVNPGGSNCANPIVGGAGDCTVLELDGSKVDITGPPGGIVGDICIGPNGHLSITGSEFVTGNVRLASGATFSKSGSGTVGGVLTGVDLTTEINAAIAASADAAGRTCTINLPSIMDATTINATGGGTAPTVVCVKDVVLNGRTVTLSGVAGDSFILNVTGKFVLNGGSRIVASGIQPKDILHNILRSGPQGAFTGWRRRAGGCGRGEGGGRVGRDATERERGGRLSRDRAGVLPRQRMDGRWAVTERPHVPERAALGASGGGVARGGHDESRAGDWGPGLRD